MTEGLLRNGKAVCPIPNLGPVPACTSPWIQPRAFSSDCALMKLLKFLWICAIRLGEIQNDNPKMHHTASTLGIIDTGCQPDPSIVGLIKDGVPWYDQHPYYRIISN